MIFNMTGGGAPLNFKVVGGTTQPTDPKENMIWVNTSTEITGYYFSATQPENMENGEVYFYTGKTNPVEFNALKKNTVMVYPISVKQMTSGELKDVVAKIYQNEKWIDWDIYFLKGSDFCDSFTGGWKFYMGSRTSDYTMGKYEILEDGIILNPTGNRTGIGMQTINKINFDNIVTLDISSEVVDAGALPVGIYLTDSDQKLVDSVDPSSEIPIALRFSGDTLVDVSNIIGSWYIVFQKASWTQGGGKDKIKSLKAITK